MLAFKIYKTAARVAQLLMSHTFAVNIRAFKHIGLKVSDKTYFPKPYHYSQLII